jgi:hypothetical protein
MIENKANIQQSRVFARTLLLKVLSLAVFFVARSHLRTTKDSMSPPASTCAVSSDSNPTLKFFGNLWTQFFPLNPVFFMGSRAPAHCNQEFSFCSTTDYIGDDELTDWDVIRKEQHTNQSSCLLERGRRSNHLVRKFELRDKPGTIIGR